MDSQEQNNSINSNKLQICSRCQKTLPIELYLHNKTSKQFRTCIHCRTRQSEKSKRLQVSNSDDAEPVTQFTNFDEFLDFYSEQLEGLLKAMKVLDLKSGSNLSTSSDGK